MPILLKTLHPRFPWISVSPRQHEKLPQCLEFSAYSWRRVEIQQGRDRRGVIFIVDSLNTIEFVANDNQMNSEVDTCNSKFLLMNNRLSAANTPSFGNFSTML